MFNLTFLSTSVVSTNNGYGQTQFGLKIIISFYYIGYHVRYRG